MIWVTNTKGKKDAILTLSLWGFFAVIGKVLLAGVAIELVAGHTINFGTIDAGVVAAVLTPTLGAYVARRHTDARHERPAASPPKAVSPAVEGSEPRWKQE